MSKETYPVRTFTLTLRITETPVGAPAIKRLAQVMKYAGRVQGFKCIKSEEVKTANDVMLDAWKYADSKKGDLDVKEKKK